MQKAFHEENRLSWNEATIAHNSHKGDQAKFLREGGSTLFPEELELLGDLQGRSLVHLQCNAGQDTLSLARLGAEVTGVDISDTAIDFARQLSQGSGIPGTFERMDVYDWLEQVAQATQRFDIVFSSYGAICWLSDLQNWARGIAAILKPGGRLVVVDFHPFMNIFEWDLERKYSYFTEKGTPFTWEEGIGDYVSFSKEGLVDMEYAKDVEGVKDFKNPHRSHEFQYTLGDLVTALLESGLTLKSLKEYPYSNGFHAFERMRVDGRRYYLPDDQPNMPLMYSISAQK